MPGPDGVCVQGREGEGARGHAQMVQRWGHTQTLAINRFRPRIWFLTDGGFFWTLPPCPALTPGPLLPGGRKPGPRPLPCLGPPPRPGAPLVMTAVAYTLMTGCPWPALCQH